jgi:hypothetical protein
MMLRKLALALSFAVPACAVDTLPIAKLDMSDGGDDDRFDGGPDSSGHQDRPTPCRSNEDCDEGEYCEKPCDPGAPGTCCDPGALGTCLPPPTVCPPSQESPVCGCDHVTYFDDCSRQRKRVQLAMRRDCPQRFAMACGELSAPCPDGAYCARLFVGGMQCAPDAPGTCWILPSTCGPPASGADRWNPCIAGRADRCQN